jgi:acetyl/propionyl-CoA carboxylase alpha subunit/acetyl-CoA carboxylase carboxyltransferase component
MTVTKLLIANRGEIAIRIARAAGELGIAAVAVYSRDDAHSLHVRIADEAHALPVSGAAAYLDAAAIIATAQGAGCDAIHPGYGFLAERADFARACAAAGLTFVGPSPEHLELFGDKARARIAAAAADVPVIRGIDRPVSLAEAQAFFAATESGEASHGGASRGGARASFETAAASPGSVAMIIKAVAGGGGRGTRAVTTATEIEPAYNRCVSEATAAFGRGDVYVEQFIPRARHIEVQILGDRDGGIAHLGERECSLQRRFQKIVEIAPAPGLDDDTRIRIIEAAVRFARSVRYGNLGTFEFLVDAETGAFVFIEANARLQVEHTVTEAVTGIDLVQSQIRLARGASLRELGLHDPAVARPRGYAIQTRINMETIAADGSVRPGGGTLTVYETPSGPGIRTDGFGYAGYRTSSAFDPLLAKLIAHTPSAHFADAVTRCARALSEFRIEGVATNISFLRAILAHPDFASARLHTRWVDEQLVSLAAAAADQRPRFAEAASALMVGAPLVGAPLAGAPLAGAPLAGAPLVGAPSAGAPLAGAPSAGAPFAGATAAPAGAADSGFAGARVTSRDPLALFAHDAEMKAAQATATAETAGEPEGPDGSIGLVAPIQGTIVSIDVAIGDAVRQGQQVAVVEAMKMEHVITARHSGIVRGVTMAAGDVVREGYPLVFIQEAEVAGSSVAAAAALDPDHIRPDLQETIDRHAFTLDENRPEAVARRRRNGYRMPRENIAELADPGSFKEYWPLVVARQHQRYDIETLRRNTPADGVVAGMCSINGDLFDDEHSRAAIVHYDYTVLAGTQGGRNHYKQDRMFELANRFRLPLILFGEGGGGRPGDDNIGPRVAIDTHTFTQFSKLSGLVPMIAVVNGRCFAGNTALVASCDVIIATEGTTLAMGGPAMIEGGGLGIYTPEEVGPMSFQVPNGVVDILVRDEAAAVRVTKQYLSYFQGPLSTWEAPDQRPLRHVVPENRLRLYDMRTIVETLADQGSVLEIRPKFGIGIITAFIRVEGRPMGVIANNPHHLAGAIDSNGADKAARFMQLCDAFDIPVLSLIDCPGIMVGPEVERTALVRHSVRLFNAGANLTTPFFSVVVRKSYGLGAQAMLGAGSLVGFFTVAWPTAEFAGMNIEGAVKLGYRKELMAIEDPDARRAEFDARVARAYDVAKAVNATAGGGIDDVIDPAETRSWIASGLRRLPPVPPRTGKKYPYIDPW